MNSSKKLSLIALAGVAVVLNNTQSAYSQDLEKQELPSHKEEVRDVKKNQTQIPASFEAMIEQPEGGDSGSSPSHNF